MVVPAVPSPHSQLWRWEIEAFLKSFSTSTVIIGDLVMAGPSPSGTQYNTGDLWFGVRGAAGSSPYFAWNDKADSTGTDVMTLSETGNLTVNGRVALGDLAATGAITGNFTYNNSSADTPSLTVDTGLLQNIAAITGQRQGLQIFNGNNTAGPSAMAFHRSGAFACYLGLDTDNVMKIGGWSYGAAAYPIAMMSRSNPGDFTAAGSVWAGQNFISTTAAVVLAPNGAGTVYFRPQGAGSGTNQCYITSAGTLVLATQCQADTYIANGGATNPGSTNAHTINLGFIDTSRNVNTVSAVHRFFTPSGLAGQITTTNATTAYGTSSDIRMKRDVGPATDARVLMDAIRVIQFEFEQTGPEPLARHQTVQGVEPPADQTLIGVSAQQLYTVYPHAVIPPTPQEGDDYDPDAKPGEKGFLPWMVDHSKLVPMLMATLQQACAKIEELEARIEALEAKGP